MRPTCASSVMLNREISMRNTNLMGPWVRRFLLEHLVAERNLAPILNAVTGIRWFCCSHS